MSSPIPELPPELRYDTTESFIRLLDTIGCTLAVSVYMQGRLILVSASNGKLDVQTAAFARPMGLATMADAEGLRLAVATHHELVVLGDAPLLAGSLPEASGRYEHLLVPRAVYFTGDIDAHDLVWSRDGLFAANTRFSCIARIDAACSFTPVWTPPFVTRLMPEDRCHLNGLATVGDRIAYATMLGRSDKAGGWSPGRAHGGLLVDVASGEAVLENLSMPHSPRVFDDRLYVLESGTGSVLQVDAAAKASRVLADLPGFTRGLDRFGDILFVGLSRIRERARVQLPLQEKGKQLMCGIAAVERSHGIVIGWLQFDQAFDEIFDVKVLPKFRNGAVLGTGDARNERAVVLPGRAFWAERLQDTSERIAAIEPQVRTNT
jgi:uncharacterized protein (TIGR03032 family)